MGNTTVWKPATTSLLSNYYLMKIFEEAGMPAGGNKFRSRIRCNDKQYSTETQRTWPEFISQDQIQLSTPCGNRVSDNLSTYKSYPKLVGETGGKDFIFAHQSANPLELATAIVRGLL